MHLERAMTNEELSKTIEYLKRFVFLMADRPDGEQLKEPIDLIKAEIRKREDLVKDRVGKST